MLRNYASYDPVNFCDDLKGVNWDSCIPVSNVKDLNHSDVDNLWENFKQAFTTVASRHVPVMTKKVRGIDCPWMNSEIKRSMRQRDYYLAKARRTNNDEDWCLYRSQRNRVPKQVTN